MKKLVLLLLASLPHLVSAQEAQYTVKGSLGKYNAPAKVYIQYRINGKPVSDSIVLKDGKFQFTGLSAGAPVNAYLIFNEKGTGIVYKDYRSIYLEPGTIKINSKDLLANATVEGTKTNMDNQRYEQALKPINAAYDSLEAKKNAATDEQKKSDSFDRDYSKAEKAIDVQDAAVNKRFIQDDPDSYISLKALENYVYSADYVDIAPLFDALSPAIKNTEAGKKFAERLPKLKAVALGATAPEFAEADTSGNMVKLSSFRGKYVLVDFWASWCGPCRHENPNVVKAFNRYKGQKFTIIGVSLDRPGAKEKWLKAIHTDGLTWTQLSDLKFWDSKTADMYAVRAIPQNFLLDPDGKIIGKNLRGADLDDKLAEIFGKI